MVILIMTAQEDENYCKNVTLSARHASEDFKDQTFERQILRSLPLLKILICLIPSSTFSARHARERGL